MDQNQLVDIGLILVVPLSGMYIMAHCNFHRIGLITEKMIMGQSLKLAYGPESARRYWFDIGCAAIRNTYYGPL